MAAGLLLAFALHGALLFSWRQPRPSHEHAGDNAYPLLALRLYAPARPITGPIDHAARPVRRQAWLATTRPGGEVPSASPAISPAFDTAAPPVDSATPPSAPALDIELLKSVARKNAGDGERHALPDAAPILSASDRTQRALEQARRPRCDNDYKPGGGQVEFQQLMKIPFMLKEGFSDSGCHW